MQNELGHLFIIGGGIGLFCAILGAFVEYMLVFKGPGKEERNLPGCMLLMAGALSLVGIVAIGIAFLVFGTVWPAVVVGLGVGFGFLCGFTTLFLVAIFK